MEVFFTLILVSFCINWRIMPQNRSTFHELNCDYGQTATSADILRGKTQLRQQYYECKIKAIKPE